MTEQEATDRARALCREIEADVGRMDPRSEWAAARHAPGIALIAAALRDAHAAGVRAGQERMRDKTATIDLLPLMNEATTYDPTKGERPICYDCTRGVAKALELYRAAIRALPLEEPE